MAKTSDNKTPAGSIGLIASDLGSVLDKPFEDYLEQLRGIFDLSGKIVLIHCPTFSFEAFSREVAQKQGYYVYPPTGLQCLKAALEGEMGIDAEILDLNYEILVRIQQMDDSDTTSLTDLLRNILEEYFQDRNVSIAGVSAGVIVSNIYGVKDHPFLTVLNYLKEKNEQLVIAGGVIATNEWKNIVADELAHFVFKGESEDQLTFFLKKIQQQESSGALTGINFKFNGVIHETKGTVGIVDFHWDLVKTYKQIPIEKYHQVGSLSPFSRMLGTERTYSTIQLNRGCRANCSFCGVTPFMGKGVRSYPIDSVVSEIKYLALERGVQHLEWLDDDLLRYRDSLIQVMNQMTELKLNLTWAANNGLIGAAMDEELLQTMVDSGCIGFRIGVESGNDAMLRKIRKPATKKTLRNSAELLAKFPELFAVGCYIIGFDDETYQQILDTFQFCIELDLSWSGFSVCQVIRDSTNVTEEFDTGYEVINDFVPPKATSRGTIDNVTGFDVRTLFATGRDEVHAKKNLDEIWFAFNLLSNYICNKNLMPGGRPDLFVQWVEALQLSHPTNAIMSLFVSLGATVAGDDKLAKEQWEFTQSLLGKSEYWVKRFQQYSLHRIIEHRPANASDVHQHLEYIREEYKSLLHA